MQCGASLSHEATEPQLAWDPVWAHTVQKSSRPQVLSGSGTTPGATWDVFNITVAFGRLELGMLDRQSWKTKLFCILQVFRMYHCTFL